MPCLGLDGGEVVRNLDVAAISSRRQTGGGAIALHLTNQSLRRNKIDTVLDRRNESLSPLKDLLFNIILKQKDIIIAFDVPADI